MRLNLEKINIVFLSLYLFGFSIEGLTFLKYGGLYGSILIFIIRIAKERDGIVDNFKDYYFRYKILFNWLFLFILSIIVSMMFAFSDVAETIREFRIQFLNMTVFIMISLSIKNRKLLLQSFIFSILSGFIYDTIYYLAKYIKHNPKLNLSIRLDRNFAVYFDFLYPFVLGGIFFLKNRLRYLLIVFLAIATFEVVLTGARGTWVSAIAETVLFGIMISIINKNYLKKVLAVGAISLIVVLIGGSYIYKNSKLIQFKIHQGLSTSGRTFIIKSRFPIIMEHGNILFGIGGPGSYQYITLLNHYHAPKKYGHYSHGVYRYSADDPYLLQIFYKEGLFGLVTFLGFTYLFLLYSYRLLKQNTRYKFILISITASFIGYFLIRGLVEGRDLRFLILYFGLFLLASQKENNESL